MIKYRLSATKNHTFNHKIFNNSTTMQTRSGRNVRAPVNEYTDRDFTPGSGFIGADHYDRAYGGGNVVLSAENESSLPNRYDYTDHFLVDSQEDMSDISLTEDEDEFTVVEETESESEPELHDDEDEMSDDEEDEDEMSDDEEDSDYVYSGEEDTVVTEDKDAPIHPESDGFETPPPTPPRLERQNAFYRHPENLDPLPIPPLMRSNHHADQYPEPIELFPVNEVLGTETDTDDSETEYDSESECESESDFESDEEYPIVFNITFNIDSVRIRNFFASSPQSFAPQ